MPALYRFSISFRRMGSLEGVFIAEPEDVAATLGKTVYFGEALGKHSDVYFDLEPGMIEKLTDDPAALEIVKTYKLTSGYNPLDYVRCSTCGEIASYHTGPMHASCPYE